MNNETFDTAIIALFLMLVIVFITSLVFAWPVMILWNWLMPALFGITKLTFWQSWGLMFLTGLLFDRSSISSSSK